MLDQEETLGLAFLRRHLPAMDRGALFENHLVENVRLAFAARREPPCGMNVPDEIFLEHVLPHAFLDERRDRWRPLMFDRLAELARRAASIYDAVSALNRAVYEAFDVDYHPTKRPHDNMSPFESREYGYASCTGLSILLAAACRSVGIPARIAGTPAWRDGSGNHNWVEIWDFGQWHFVGALEPGPYDLCWFNDKAREVPVFATRYSPSGTHFPLAWAPDDRSVPGDDVTARYRACAPTPRDATEIIVQPRGYRCLRVARPLRLAGDLSDPQWRDIPWTQDFVDIEGHKKPAPRFRTRAKMCWDDRYFYVGAEIEDPHVWATLTEKNSFVFNDPDFEVFIDPDGDNHDYYEFEVNPLGTIWELWLERPYRDGGPVHRGHNLEGVRYAVAVHGTINDPRDTDRGWSLEVAFPWEALKRFAGARACPPRDGDEWRVNFSRVHWLADIVDGAYRKVPREAHPEDNWVWTPQHAVDMHRPEMWGVVEFADAPRRRPVRDRLWPARELLMDLYYQQRARPAPSGDPADFVFRGVRHPKLSDLRVSCDGDTWSASVRCGSRELRIDHTGRLT